MTPLGLHNFSFMSPFTGEQNLVLGVAAAGLHLVGQEAALDAPDQDITGMRLLNLSWQSARLKGLSEYRLLVHRQSS